MWNHFWWGIYPYLMLTIFVAGHIYRYKTDQLGWTAKSSEFLEKNRLKWASILFHTGVLLAFGGHVVGLLIPQTVTASIGISERLYHIGAISMGSLAGLLALAGIFLLFTRRVSVKRVRVTSSFTDLLVVTLLVVVISMGVGITLGYNLLADSNFNYRATVGPWIRGILLFNPAPALMRNVPLVFRLHIIFAFGIFGIWPFTRLVHIWSVPLDYLRRSYILYRRHQVPGITAGPDHEI